VRVIIGLMKKTSSRSIPEHARHATRDPLLRALQTVKARKGMRRAFNASPSKLGKCAVEVARKNG
jgi:hypothetical protein